MSKEDLTKLQVFTKDGSYMVKDVIQEGLDDLAPSLETAVPAFNDKVFYFDRSEGVSKVTNLNDLMRSGVGFDSGNERWLGFDFDGNRKTVKIKAGYSGVHIRLDITNDQGDVTEVRWFDVNEDTSYDFTDKINSRGGRNIYLYIVPDGDSGTALVASDNGTYPNDVDPSYTAFNSRKIGQFHTLCASVDLSLTAKLPGTEAVNSYVLTKHYDSSESGYYDFYRKKVTASSSGALTVGHPLAGFNAGDILPESVWCLSFRPYSSPDGMSYDKDTDAAIDIYLQSGTGSSTRSEYGATHTVSRPQINHQDDLRCVRKRLLTDYEFSSAAIGSNQQTAIEGATDKGTVGGHKDTAGKRMVSFIGIEEACGYLWQWLEEYGPLGTGAAGNNGTEVQSGWGTPDGSGAFGASHYVCVGLIAGGDWSNSSLCGSRCRNSSDSRSCVSGHVGGRGSSRVVRKA